MLPQGLADLFLCGREEGYFAQQFGFRLNSSYFQRIANSTV